MKYGYKEVRRMDSMNLRSLCIKQDWYTAGNIVEYANLLDTANGYDNITCDELVELATDIKSHSHTDYEIESIMYALCEICHSYFEEA